MCVCITPGYSFFNSSPYCFFPLTTKIFPDKKTEALTNRQPQLKLSKGSWDFSRWGSFGAFVCVWVACRGRLWVSTGDVLSLLGSIWMLCLAPGTAPSQQPSLCVPPPLDVGFAPSADGLSGDGDLCMPAVPWMELALDISVPQISHKGDEVLPALGHHERRQSYQLVLEMQQ